jgi:hypothetical protein
MRPLLLNTTFHCLAVLFVFGLVRQLAASGSSRSAIRHLTYLISSNFFIAFLVFGTLVNLGLRFTAGYINPRDFLQDVIAAKRYTAGETLYPENLGQLATAENARPFLGEKFLRGIPLLRSEFAIMHENVEQNAHLPLNAVVFAIPVSVLGARGSFVVTWLVSMVLLVAALRLVQTSLSLRWSTRELFVILLLLFGWYPVISALRSGQSGCAIALLCIAAWVLLRNGREGAAGVLVGIAACLNAFPLFLLGYFLFRARRALAFGVCTILVLTAATLMTSAPNTLAEWASTASRVSNAYIPIRGNYSIAALIAFPLTQYSYQPDYRLLTLGAAGSCAIAIVLLSRLWQPRGSARALDLEYSAFLVAMLLASPLCWERYFPVLILPFAVFFQTTIASDRPIAYAGFAALALLSVPPSVVTYAFEWLLPVAGLPASLAITTVPLMSLVLLFGLLIRLAISQRDSDRAAIQ